MSILRTIAIAAVTVLLPLTSVSTSFSAADAQTVPAGQPMNQVAPLDGAKLKSPYPTFSWQLPVGAGNTRVVVSTSPKTDAAGYLPDFAEPNYRVETAKVGASTLTSKNVYEPGKYYWQVVAQDLTTGTAYLSTVRSFTAPVYFELVHFRAKIAKNGANNINQVEVNGSLKCSVAYGTKNHVLLTIKVYKGTKRIGTQEREAGDCNSMSKTREFANFQPQPGSIKKGTKLTVKVFASFGKSKSDAAALKVTWK